MSLKMDLTVEFEVPPMLKIEQVQGKILLGYKENVVWFPSENNFKNHIISNNTDLDFFGILLGKGRTQLNMTGLKIFHRFTYSRIFSRETTIL